MLFCSASRIEQSKYSSLIEGNAEHDGCDLYYTLTIVRNIQIPNCAFFSQFFANLSEVLLSSEARMVTYVSKQNVRSEHSLEEVLQTGMRFQK